MEVVLCKPTYYDVQYTINPWMQEGQVDVDKAHEQWEKVVSTLLEQGIKVHLLNPSEGLPDMVFAANFGCVVKKNFMASNMKNKERQPEIPHAVEQLTKITDLEVHQCPFTWEGQAELFHLKKNVYLGAYGHRGTKEALDWLADHLKIDIIPLQLIDEMFYHLDVCLTIREGKVYYYDKAFKSEEIDEVKKHVECIAVPKDFAHAFCLNAIQAPKAWICNTVPDSCKDFVEEHELPIIEVDVSEYIKAGGGVQCMSLTLKH